MFLNPVKVQVALLAVPACRGLRGPRVVPVCKQHRVAGLVGGELKVAELARDAACATRLCTYSEEDCSTQE